MKALLRQCFFISIITEDFALKRTTNYALPDWEKSDFIQMSDFNDLTHKLDAALKAEADARAAADSTASELLTTLHQTVTKSKLCRIKYGSYTGNGKSPTQASPKSLSCGFYPLAFIIFYNGYPCLLIRGQTTLYDHWSDSAVVTWNDSDLSWYAPSSRGNAFNDSGAAYNYLILGCDKD